MVIQVIEDGKNVTLLVNVTADEYGILAMMLVLMLALAAVACGDKETENTDTETETETAEVTESETVEDEEPLAEKVQDKGDNTDDSWDDVIPM